MSNKGPSGNYNFLEIKQQNRIETLKPVDKPKITDAEMKWDERKFHSLVSSYQCFILCLISHRRKYVDKSFNIDDERIICSLSGSIQYILTVNVNVNVKVN